MRLVVDIPEARADDERELRLAVRNAVYEAGFGRVTVAAFTDDDVELVFGTGEAP